MSEESLRKENPDFLPVPNDTEKFKLLHLSARKIAKSTIWSRDHQFLIDTNLTLLGEKDSTLHFAIPEAFDENSLALAIKEKQDFLFSVSNPNANLFFKSSFKNKGRDSLCFHIPEKIFKVQRRRSMRAPIREGYVVRAEFPDPLFPDKALSRKILDISGHGLAFLGSPDDEILLPIGMIIHHLRFKLEGVDFDVDVEVRHFNAYQKNNEAGTKFGLQFIRISPQEIRAIDQYALRENRRLLSSAL